MLKKVTEMPPQANGYGPMSVNEWLTKQPEMIEWVQRELVRSGAIRYNGHDKRWWPGGALNDNVKLGLTTASVVTKLSADHVVSMVKDGVTRASTIVKMCQQNYGVSRRTVDSRLKEAVDQGRLMRTTPLGCYTLGDKK